MLRQFLTVVLPMALPFIVYFAYVALARRRSATTGKAPGVADAPWPWLAATGVVLVAAVLIGWRLVSDPAQPGEQILPDRYIDGELVPSEIIRE